MKQLIFSLLAGLLLLAPSVGLAQVSFDGLGSADGNVGLITANSGLTDRDLTDIIGGFIQVALSLLGIIFLLLVLYAGFLWMTAGGNDDQIKQAKSLMTNGAVGLVIIITSFAISSFVMSALSTATT